MPGGQLDSVVRFLRRVAGDPGPQAISDAQLLDRFRSAGDADAFALLVRRHGRLVRSVCQNVLKHDQDTDDAFQVTFLVFATKAACIRKTTAIASWLHGVAYRTAMNAKRARNRNVVQEGEIESRPADQPPTAAALRELQAMVDEELNRLAEKYRAPFVLCCLEGKSRSEAAQELRLKEGTLSSRLAQARKVLQQRLTRRGVTLSAALCAVELGRGGAAAAVGPALVSRTIEAALTFAAGKAVVGELISAPVAALAKGVLQGMLATKLKIATALLLTVGLMTGAGVLARQTLLSGAADVQQSERPRPDGRALNQPIADEGKKPRTDLRGDPLPPGALVRLGSTRLRHPGTATSVVYVGDLLASSGRDGAIMFWDAATGKLARQFRGAEGPVFGLAFAADRNLLAAEGPSGDVYVWDAATGKEVQRFRGSGNSLHIQPAFSPGGSTLAVADKAGVRIWDVKTGMELRMLAVPGFTAAVSFASDGRTLAASGSDQKVRNLGNGHGQAAPPVRCGRDNPGGKRRAALSISAAPTHWSTPWPIPKTASSYSRAAPVERGFGKRPPATSSTSCGRLSRTTFLPWTALTCRPMAGAWRLVPLMASSASGIGPKATKC